MATQKHSQTHPTARQLAAFALGKLAPDGRGRMQQHLDGCPECSTFLSKTPRDKLVDLLRQPTANVPASEQSTPGVRDSSTVMPPADGAPAAALPSPRRPAQEKRAGQPAAASPPRTGAKPTAVDEFVAALGEQTKYRVVRLLGHGGMGRVYEAYHERMGRRVALKVIDSPLLKHPDALRRFDQEVKAAANLDHPNLARAFDADEFGSTHVLVMEFIAGESLDKVLAQEGPMPVARACDCIRQAAAGLAHAHQQGMVHRDLKPQNLMLTPEGRVKILDFGLAKVTKQSPSRAGLTRENSLMGTPHYLAPEQALDAASADIRADIYSLGCTLYCLLTGSPPFEGDTEMKVLLAHQQQAARPLCEARPDVPRELSDLVARMLAKNPAERPQSPVEVGGALQPFTTAARPAAQMQPPVAPVVTPVTSSPATVEIPFADEPLRTKGTRQRTTQPAAQVEKRSLLQSWQDLPPHVRWPSIVALGLAGFFLAFWGISVLLRTPQGTILVENVPEDARVIVDDAVVTIKRDRDLVTIEAVNKGEHTLKITRDGKSFWSKEVTIDFAGEQVTATYSPFAAKQNDTAETNPPSKEKPADAPTNELGSSKPYVPPTGIKPIDLLSLIDLRTDTIGNWSSEGGTIRSNDDLSMRVQLPRVPPEVYDLCVEFSPTSHARKEVGIVCRGGGRQFVALAGAYGNRYCGFELYEGKLCNVTGKRGSGDWLTVGRRHEMVVQVRNSGVTMLLDGAEVSKAEGPWSRFSLDATYKLKRDDVLGLVSSRAVRFDKVELYEIKGTGRDARMTRDDAPAVAGGIRSLPEPLPKGNILRTVDLMPLVDPENDAIEGKWTRIGEEFHSDNFWPANLRIPYRPPSEYDFRVAFTRVEGRNALSLLFPKGAEDGAFLLGSHDNSLGGFALVNGNGIEKNPTGFRSNQMLQNGKRYEVALHVRKDMIAASVDGKLVASHKTGISGLSIPAEWGVGSGLLGVSSAASPTIIHKLEIAEITGAGVKADVLPAGDVPSLNRPLRKDKPLRVVNLLALVDPARDTIHGVWNKEAGELHSDRARDARIRIPYDPPEEYDLHTEFTRTAGRADVFNILSYGAHNFYFLLAGGVGTGGGFGLIEGRWAGDNPTAIRSHGMLRNGRKYDLVVNVRRNEVAASVDGKLVAEYRTDYSVLTLQNAWAIADGRLGVGSSESPTTFHKIEIAEIKGAGKPMRPADAKGPSANSNADLTPAMRDYPECELIASGNWRIENDEMVQASPDVVNTGIAFGDPNWTSYNVHLHVKSDAGSDGFSIAWHATGKDATLRCRLIRLGVFRNSRFDSVAMIDGRIVENDDQARPRSVERGIWHDVKLEVRGPKCTCYLDREKIFEVNDPRFNSGQFGLGAFATVFRFKDVVITSADGKTVLWHGLPKLPGTSAAGKTVPSVKAPADAKRHGNSYYKVYPEWMTWQQARDRCLTLGGHLAVVQDRDTNDFLTELAHEAHKEEVWLGATDEVQEGKWVWVDGRPMVYTNWDVAVQQPNNKDGAEHNLLMRAGVFGKWSDQPNISTQFTPGFVCQWD